MRTFMVAYNYGAGVGRIFIETSSEMKVTRKIIEEWEAMISESLRGQRVAVTFYSELEG